MAVAAVAERPVFVGAQLIRNIFTRIGRATISIATTLIRWDENTHTVLLLCLISNAIGPRPRTVCVQSDVDCSVQPPFWLLTFIQQPRRTRRLSWVKGSSHTTLFLFCCLLVGLSVRIIRLLSDVFLFFFLCSARRSFVCYCYCHYSTHKEAFNLHQR